MADTPLEKMINLRYNGPKFYYKSLKRRTLQWDNQKSRVALAKPVYAVATSYLSLRAVLTVLHQSRFALQSAKLAKTSQNNLSFH